MLNLTFGTKLHFSEPFRKIVFELEQFPRLQSLALRNTPHPAQFNHSLWHILAKSELIILDLSHNDIERLDRDMFLNMYHLTVVILNGNPIHSIDQYPFCGGDLPMLYSANLVQTLSAAMFTSERDCNAFYECDLTKLHLLRLSVRQIPAMHPNAKGVLLQPFAFSRFRHLNELQVSGSGVIGIDDDAFACLTELRNLFLSYNNVQYLSLQTFSHLSSLQQLLLDNNSLNNMSARIFRSNHQLVYLNASYNMIGSLEDRFLLTSIKCLDFSHNRIDHIRNNTFSFCLKLERLYLQYNSLNHIESGAFTSVRRLRILNLAHNRLAYVSQYLFADMSSLSELYLNDNHIKVIAFGSLPVLRLQILNLAHNSLSYIRKDILANFSLLSELHLNDNIIRNIEIGAFLSAERLQILNLAHNRLHTVSMDLLPGMSLLRELYLNDNLIRHIEDGAFLSAESLQILNLASNRLSNVSKELFADMPVLSELYLNDNLLRYIEVDILLFHSTILSGVTLGGNPWDCNCDLDPLSSWLKEYGDITLDLHEVTCFQTKAVIALSESFCEEQNPLLPVIGILIALLFVLAAGSVTVYKFRRDIQVLLFAKYGIRLPWKRFPDTEDQNRTYDAFVSYNNSDERFVLRELMPELERQPPFYKLCLHFRDFALGAAVAENIIEAIDTSKRTIMLVSKDFLQSDWCQYEFQMAHHQVLSEGGRNRLILVMMERINISDITDHTLKSYIRTHTYIEKNDPRFWERLRFALPDRKDMIADSSADQA